MGEYKCCLNCEYGHLMCGMVYCIWNEAYVRRTGTCPRWVKKVKENDK